jgi:hypothetical protein
MLARRLERGDVEATAALLARAMDDDPAYRFLFPRAAERQAGLAGFAVARVEELSFPRTERYSVWSMRRAASRETALAAGEGAAELRERRFTIVENADARCVLARVALHLKLAGNGADDERHLEPIRREPLAKRGERSFEVLVVPPDRGAHVHEQTRLPAVDRGERANGRSPSAIEVGELDARRLADEQHDGLAGKHEHLHVLVFEEG